LGEKTVALPNLRIITGPKTIEGTTPYSPENLLRGFREAHKVLLPTRAGVEYKSPNRLLESLRMGLFPICGDLPAYKEFKRFIWTGEIWTGLRWTKHFRSDLNDLAYEGQDYIRDRYSPERIAKLWLEVCESV